MTSATRIRRLLLSLCAVGALLPIVVVARAAPADPPAAAELSRREIAGRIAPAVVLVTTESDGESRQGSGFFVDPRGVIVTALHVVDGAKKVTITLSDGRRIENAGVRAFDVEKDLAVLLVEVPTGGKEIAAAVLGKPAAAAPGDPILVVSNPLGFKETVTEGIVSAWREPGAEDGHGDGSEPSMRRLLPSCRLLQISASISPGSSGGPVADQRGEVIGVATAGVLYGLAGLNFAVPVNELSALLAADGAMDLGTFQSRLKDARLDLAHPHFENAQIAFEQGRRPEAKRQLERAILLFPAYEEALLLMARMLAEEGNLEAALERVTEAVKANGESAEAWYRLARLYDVMARDKSSTSLLARAQAAYEKSLALDPRHAQAALGLAVIQVRQGLLTQAEDLLRRAIAADPNLADAYYMLGEIHLGKLQMGDAEEAFTKALWADRDHALSHFALARLYTLRDPSHMEKARSHWQDFLRLAQDDPSLAEEREFAHRMIERYFPQMVDW